MATKIYLRRGTQAEILAIVPEMGEPVWATDTGDLYVGDGATSGGIWIAGPGVQQINGLENAVTLSGGSGIMVTVSGQYLIIDEEAGGLDVDSLNALTGDVVLVGTGNVNITKLGQNILISGMLHAATHTDGTDDIQDADADGATKGIAAFLAADFAAAGGVISLAADVIRDADFNDHSARHETSGADEISLSGLEGELVVLTDPVINGVVTTVGLTLPALKLGGAIDANGQDISSLDWLQGQTSAELAILSPRNTGANCNAINFYTRNAADDGWLGRFLIGGKAAEASAWWSDISHIGFKLGGTLDANAQQITNVGYLTVTEYRGQATAAILATYNADDAYFAFNARFHGIGQGEVARIQNAVAPTFDLKYGRLTGTLLLNSQVFDAGSGELALNTTGAATGLTITSVQDGAAGAMFVLRHNSTTPAINDKVGVFAALGKNSAAQWVTYAEMQFRITDKTDGTEDGRLEISLMRDGTATLGMTLSHAGILTLVGGLDATTLQGTLTLNSQSLDAGAGNLDVATTGVGAGLAITDTVDNFTGVWMLGKHIRAAPAAGDYPLQIVAQGGATGSIEYGRIRFKCLDVTGAAEIGGIEWYLMSGGAGNLAMSLSGAGELWVDTNILIDEFAQFTEMAAPGQGAANTARIYALEGGDTLTDLCAVFQDGSIDVFAQETTDPDSPIFQFPNDTPLRLLLKKPDKKTVRFVAIFPDGRDFVMREIRYPSERWK